MSLTGFHRTQGYILTVPMYLSAKFISCSDPPLLEQRVFFFFFFPPPRQGRPFPVVSETCESWKTVLLLKTEVRKTLSALFFFVSFIASSLVWFSSSPMFSLLCFTNAHLVPHYTGLSSRISSPIPAYLNCVSVFLLSHPPSLPHFLSDTQLWHKGVWMSSATQIKYKRNSNLKYVETVSSDK